MNNEFTIALAGNPNCGKTTLFNALTGAKQHVGNWAGVTVEKKEGSMSFENKKIKVVDLPGTYSLGAYSEDEVVARNYILDGESDIIVNVVDATNIERNLYLTMQLLETATPIVVALNMMDEAKKKNIYIDVDMLSKELGVPVVPMTAIKEYGVKDVVREALKGSKHIENQLRIKYNAIAEIEILKITKMLSNKLNIDEAKSRYMAIRAIEGDKSLLKRFERIEDIEDQITKSIEIITKNLGYEPDIYVVDERYGVVNSIVTKVVKREEIIKENLTDKIDKIIINKWIGMPIFALIMFVMYQITMTLGNDILAGYVGEGFEALGETTGNILVNYGAPDIVKSFIIDGVIGGIGSVLTFVPMMFTMYFLISLLEDSGYMARAAYVMDRFMSLMGLHGKTAVSLIIGTGCNVAGIMSTRTLEGKKDRMIAILINPFISCSARLPVYALFVGIFFADQKIWGLSMGGLIIFGLYVLGIAVAVIVGRIFSRTLFKGDNSYFVMELPPYRIPTIKGLFIHMWEKSASFIKKAGTVIFVVVVVIWALSNLPAGVEPGTVDSLLGKIGSFLSPIFSPAGFGNWQSTVALIAGICAKEATVATFGVVLGAGTDQALSGGIQQIFTPLTAIAFMVMTLLYVPCIAAVGAIKRETNSNKWAAFSVVYTTAIGWVAAVLVYQIGKALGFS